MNILISSQSKVFFLAISGGVLIGFAYDLLRIFRRLIKHNKIIIGIEDIVFFLITSVLMFIKIFDANYGVIRGFVLLGIVLGVLIYYSSVSSIVVKYSVFTIEKFIWVIKQIIMPLKYVAKPLVFIVKKLIMFLLKIKKWWIIKLKEIKRQIKHIHNNI
jgi:spore cortex biosynthesis protein YabQ